MSRLREQRRPQPSRDDRQGRLLLLYGGGRRRSALALAHVRGGTVKEAAEWLAGDRPRGDTKPKENVDKPNEGFKPLEYLQAEHPAVEAIGFDPDVAQALGIGFAPRGVLKGTVAIPLRR